MQPYENLELFIEDFTENRIESLPQTIQIDDVIYNIDESSFTTSNGDAGEVVFGKRSTLTYLSENDSRLTLNWVWESLTIKPSTAYILNLSHDNTTTSADEIIESTEVGFQEPVIIQGINGNQPIQAKIDTGADMCSLHATDIEVANNTVTFVFNNKRYRMNISGTQQVKQAGTDPTNRPIITITLNIAGNNVPNVECNLSDRTDMIPLLIGKNALQASDFIITTSQQENPQ
jgi:hypothetical protein